MHILFRLFIDSGPSCSASVVNTVTLLAAVRRSNQHAGRRDDLWSWLYVIVEMLDGGLCWRPDRDRLQADDKQKKKELASIKKQAALRDPALLTSHVELPGIQA